MTNPIENKIIWSENEGSRRKLIGGIEAIAEQQKKLSVQFAKGEVSTKDYTASLAKLDKEASTLKKALAPLEKEFVENRKATLAAEKAAEAEARALRETSEAAEKAALSFNDLYDAKRRAAQQSGADAAGDTASGIGSLRGGLEAVGFGGASPVLNVVEGFADLTESGKLLGAQLSAVGSSAAAAIPGISGSAAGLVALSAAAIPIAAIVGVAAVAIYKYNKAATEQAKELERAISGLSSTNQAIAGGLTTEDAQARIAELTRTREAEAATLATLQASYDSFETQLQETDFGFGEAYDIARAGVQLLTGIDPNAIVETGVKAFDAREEQLYQSIVEASTALAEMDTEINSLQRAIENNSLASNDAAATLEQLKEAETELTNTRTQATQELTASLDRIAGYSEQISQLTVDRARQQAEAAEIEALQQEFNNQDEQAETAAHFQQLASIATDGRQKIVAIQADLSKLATDRQAKLSEIETAGQSKIAKLNSEYMQKALADAKAFARESERIEADGNKARLRLIRSITDRLDQASSDNNVIEFLRAEKEGRQQLSDLAQDSNEAEKRRIEDYNAKQAEAAELQRVRLNEALQQIEADKQATIASFDEKRQALVDSIATEKQAIAERTQAAVASYNQSEALERQQADRQEQLQALRDSHEQDAFDRSIAAISARRDAELAMYAEIQNRIAAIGSQLRSNLQAQSSAQSTASGSSSSSAFSGGMSYSDRARAERNGVTAFAEGGIVDRPTLALIGERAGMKELVMPFKSSEGIPAAFARHGMGGNNTPPINVSVTMHNTIGDVATQSMLTAQISQAAETLLYEGIQPMILNALNGVT